MGEPAGDRSVTCIACGVELPRSQAREYDKYGDRWDREGKSFEFLCKPCFRALDKQPREDLECQLETAGAGRVPDSVFLELFARRSAGDDVANEHDG